MSNFRHGYRHTRTYRIWCGMKSRCRETHPGWGDRGIRYCKRWEKFENFLADMGECPAGLSIDRRNNDGNYCKSNCRWASRVQQCSNRRQRRDAVIYRGRLVREWAAFWGINHRAARARIYYYRQQESMS